MNTDMKLCCSGLMAIVCDDSLVMSKEIALMTE